ncbi:MAG: cation:proton antiporter [Bacteroidetes bacterium]|nr:cation:proton antiporter [Bacteroidota bacterium]
MQTSVTIIIIGLFIFWGHYLSGVFERKSIPDVLGLMLIGVLIGPVFHLIDPSTFGKFGSLFSNLVLIFILFESGTELKISEVKASFKESARITAVGFFVTWVVTFALCKLVFNLPNLTCLFIGSALGGTSSAVVVGLVKKIAIKAKTSTTLIIESAETDVFTLAIPLSILGLMINGQVQTGIVISQFVASLVMSLLIGVGGAFTWSFIINKIPTLKATKFSTPAFLFIIYGLTEFLNFSGPLTALSFGIAIGNLQYFEPKLLEKVIPNHSIVLPQDEKLFFNEMVFLLRTFFFVFIGLSIHIERFDWLLWGAAITFVLFAVRILVVKFVISKSTPLLDKATMSIMIPKGLGAAVIATLPFQQGHADGVIIQSICFSVILFSTLYCVGLFFLLKTENSLGFYSMIFGYDKPEGMEEVDKA